MFEMKRIGGTNTRLEKGDVVVYGVSGSPTVAVARRFSGE